MVDLQARRNNESMDGARAQTFARPWMGGVTSSSFRVERESHKSWPAPARFLIREFGSHNLRLPYQSKSYFYLTLVPGEVV